MCLRCVGLLFVMRPNRPAHPLLIPPDLVDSIVVAATIGDRRIVKIAVSNQRSHGALPTRRSTPDTDARQIHFGTLLGGRLHPGDPIRETAVPQILPADIVKCLAAIAGPHAIDLDHDETELGHLVKIWIEPKTFWDKR